MKIALVTNESDRSLSLAAYMKEQLCKMNHEIINNKAENPELVISIGGDGTILEAFHQYKAALTSCRFLGVHTGHLGFYADWREDEIEDLLTCLATDKGTSVSYPLLEVCIRNHNGIERRELALNEAALRRYAGTLLAEVWIEDEVFEMFRGDGLCVSTPTGSTGLSKSLGGAVVEPSLNTIQLTEIASINNRVFRTLSSSLLLGEDQVLMIKPQNLDDDILRLSLDQLHEDIALPKAVTFRIAKERIHFANYRHIPFWRRVQNSFIGKE